jgi:hypothetical protein
MTENNIVNVHRFDIKKLSVRAQTEEEKIKASKRKAKNAAEKGQVVAPSTQSGERFPIMYAHTPTRTDYFELSASNIDCFLGFTDVYQQPGATEKKPGMQMLLGPKGIRYVDENREECVFPEGTSQDTKLLFKHLMDIHEKVKTEVAKLVKRPKEFTMPYPPVRGNAEDNFIGVHATADMDPVTNKITTTFIGHDENEMSETEAVNVSKDSKAGYILSIPSVFVLNSINGTIKPIVRQVDFQEYGKPPGTKNKRKYDAKSVYGENFTRKLQHHTTEGWEQQEEEEEN